MTATPANLRKKSSLQRLGDWWDRNWFKLILFYLSLHIIFNKDVSVQMDMDKTGYPKVYPTRVAPTAVDEQQTVVVQEATFVPAMNVSLFPKPDPVKRPEPASASAKGRVGGKPGFSMRNLTPILNPDYARRKGIPHEIAEEKVRICRSYIEKHATAAIEEMKLYGIPASITLAQGLLESDAGESSLARESNNHFGIKCRSKCLGCTCRNYSDDDVYDMFRVFEDAAESFREHSLLLSSPRYQHLKKLGNDYQGWAYGLKRAGYATDKRYAEKLIQIINELKLYQYDQKA